MPIPAPPIAEVVKAFDICADAMREIGVYNLDEAPDASDIQFVLRKCNRMLDGWDAQRKYAYAVIPYQFTLPINLQPFTIGPASAANPPTVAINAQNRPTKIIAANVILNNVNPPVYTPVAIRDADWWQGNSVRGVAGELTTDLYYSPDWPNGSIYPWPIPTIAYGFEVWAWQTLSQLTLQQQFSLPPGYWDAIVLSLAEQICKPFGVAPDADLKMRATAARAILSDLNSPVPLISTVDSGMPRSGTPRPTFNWITGGLIVNGR